MTKLDNATTKCKNTGYVTIDALKEEFTTPAWDGLKDPESVLYKLLSTKVFKNYNKGQMGIQIDCDLLRIFGLLHCQGTIKKKAHFFYGLVQAGGVEKH